ncbi:hypothetical protein CINF_1224 [Candidatus Campylobacter infans]|uniref:Uncharacterized protein n=1 Tax=Candidatus Campylobacter infans TaxID=2561898 RepID=A0A7H9CJ60_9BACT|nr:hypothetical protein [Candidatus Campylobacter infans]QLI05711.1 hypothetical protein CINF_1224 [Candidatus Campylobacter infans]
MNNLESNKHILTDLLMSDYAFLMSLTGILVGFCFMFISFYIVTNIKA